MPRPPSTISPAKVPKVAEASRLSSSQNQRQDASATFTDRPARAEAMGLDEPWVPKTLIFAKDDSHADDILLFLRDVRSQLYFEQMKGRGTRTIDPDALASVTPDAGGKTRFVLVDAVGVTESDKTDSRPLESKPSVAFDKLLLGIAMCRSLPDSLVTDSWCDSLSTKVTAHLN